MLLVTNFYHMLLGNNHVKLNLIWPTFVSYRARARNSECKNFFSRLSNSYDLDIGGRWLNIASDTPSCYG